MQSVQLCSAVALGPDPGFSLHWLVTAGWLVVLASYALISARLAIKSRSLDSERRAKVKVHLVLGWWTLIVPGLGWILGGVFQEIPDINHRFGSSFTLEEPKGTEAARYEIHARGSGRATTGSIEDLDVYCDSRGKRIRLFHVKCQGMNSSPTVGLMVVESGRSTAPLSQSYLTLRLEECDAKPEAIPSHTSDLARVIETMARREDPRTLQFCHSWSTPMYYLTTEILIEHPSYVWAVVALTVLMWGMGVAFVMVWKRRGTGVRQEQP